MENNFLKKFKETEKKLLKKLKEASINLSEDASRDVILKAIREHIVKLNDLEVLFEKYESMAKKFAGETEDDSQSMLEKHYIDEKKLKQVFNEKKNKINKNSESKGVRKKKNIDNTTNFSK